MIDKNYFKKVRKEFHTYALVRRDVIKHAGDALHHAKRAIFETHRGNMGEAKAKIMEAEKYILELHKKYKKYPQIHNEGSYQAAVEEIVESILFYQFANGQKLSKPKTLQVADDVFLAGLCDLPGELYRFSIKAATDKDHETVKRCVEQAQAIIGEITEFDFTKYLRTKADQARGAMHKLEIVAYELSLRGEK
ncbi:hypothetical protein H6758_00600 [Candidatus Nomurabacteria bacterium]|nr:hypothetical protein [Candidatus Nomurabacteria bacterium]